MKTKKELKRVKLTALSKKELPKLELNVLRGGSDCSACGTCDAINVRGYNVGKP